MVTKKTAILVSILIILAIFTMYVAGAELGIVESIPAIKNVFNANAILLPEYSLCLNSLRAQLKSCNEDPATCIECGSQAIINSKGCLNNPQAKINAESPIIKELKNFLSCENPPTETAKTKSKTGKVDSRVISVSTSKKTTTSSKVDPSLTTADTSKGSSKTVASK